MRLSRAVLIGVRCRHDCPPRVPDLTVILCSPRQPRRERCPKVGSAVGTSPAAGNAARSTVLKAAVLDGISRELGEGSTRRGFFRLLGRVTAVAAVGALGASGLSETATAKRRGRKRGKRTTNLQEPVDQNQVSPSGGEAARATSIPPNCIYVCCDGTCDSWTMCLRCVKWPKATTTTAITGS